MKKSRLVLCALWIMSQHAAGGPEGPLPAKRIIGTNDLEPVDRCQDEEVYAKTLPVARLETMDGQGFCTAVRVASDLFLTNYHCAAYRPCEDLGFRLGYEQGVSEPLQPQFHCQALLANSQLYDYALFRADLVAAAGQDPAARLEAASRAETDYPTSTLWAGAIANESPLMAVSHPHGRWREVDRSASCRLLTAAPTAHALRWSVTHTCDTEGGSSGSPLIDLATGYVVALHWGGADGLNFAIPMPLIAGDLETRLTPADFARLSIAR